jgi:hypothetical protein
MAKIKFFLLVVFALAITIAAAAAEDQSEVGEPNPTPILSSEDESNLLTNPSFEGEYKPYDPPIPHPDCNYVICQTANMADGWTPWWIKSRPTDVNPEYKPALSSFVDPVRVMDGDRAQQYFSFESTHEAGIYQRVPVNNGTNYCFSIWGHAWSANDDENAYSGPEHGWLDQKVGVDPTGGTDPQSANIIWGPPRLQYDEYGTFTIGAAAQADYLTVFTYSKPIWSAKHNDAYWDDAMLTPVAVDGELSTTPFESLNFESYLSNPEIMTKTLTINLSVDPCLTTWKAIVEPSGSFTPTILSNHNYSGAQVTVSVNSSGYLPGTHSAAVKFEANFSMAGSPINVPVKLTVINDFTTVYIPTLVNE